MVKIEKKCLTCGKTYSSYKNKLSPDRIKKYNKTQVAKENIRRIGISNKGKIPVNYIDGSSRNRKYTWKKWINFAKEIYKRDDYTCQNCGKKGGLLNAHHILPWAGNPELAFNSENLITLCVPCHSKQHRGKI